MNHIKKREKIQELQETSNLSLEEIQDKLNENKDENKIEIPERLNAIEKGLSKIAFDTNIRAVYFADKDLFSPASSSGLMGVMRQYNTQHLNSFELKFPLVKRAWMDKKGKKVNADKESIFEQYKSRSFFYSGCIPENGVNFWLSNGYVTGKPFIMTTEELATIFHFPGDTATNSNVSRIEAKKVEAPANLPI